MARPPLPIVALLLLIALPFLLADAITLLLAPKVLWELAVLVVALSCWPRCSR